MVLLFVYLESVRFILMTRWYARIALMTAAASAAAVEVRRRPRSKARSVMVHVSVGSLAGSYNVSNVSFYRYVVRLADVGLPLRPAERDALALLAAIPDAAYEEEQLFGPGWRVVPASSMEDWPVLEGDAAALAACAGDGTPGAVGERASGRHHGCEIESVDDEIEHVMSVLARAEAAGVSVNVSYASSPLKESLPRQIRLADPRLSIPAESGRHALRGLARGRHAHDADRSQRDQRDASPARTRSSGSTSISRPRATSRSSKKSSTFIRWRSKMRRLKHERPKIDIVRRLHVDRRPQCRPRPGRRSDHRRDRDLLRQTITW